MPLFLTYILLPICLLLPSNANSQPYLNPHNLLLTIKNNDYSRSAQLNYSPFDSLSLGYKYESLKKHISSLHSIEALSLLKQSHDNNGEFTFLLKSGIVFEQTELPHSDDHLTASGFTGIIAYWLNSNFLVSYENRYTETDKLNHFFQQSVRIGTSLYPLSFADTSWLLLEINHSTELNKSLSITPLARLLRDNHIFELGISHHGEANLNYIYRF